jgi:hypothetical protein
MIEQNKNYSFNEGITVAPEGCDEEITKQMIINGMNWYLDNPKATPVLSIIYECYGLSTENNDDAKSLIEAIKKNIPSHTYEMLKTAVMHVLFAQKYGWDNYQKIIK